MDDAERRIDETDPAETPRQVARVNVHPEDLTEERYLAAGQLAPASIERDVRGAWGVPALGLGVIAVIVIVIALIVILQGVFRAMPT